MSKLDFKSGHKGFIVICGLGFILLGCAILFLVSTKSKLDNWTHTDAIVTGFKSDNRRDDDGNYVTMYQEIVEYTVDGKTFTATNTSSSNIKPSIGSVLKIAYDPSSPENCIFVSDSNIVAILLFCSVCSIYFCRSFAIPSLLYRKRNSSANRATGEKQR